MLVSKELGLGAIRRLGEWFWRLWNRSKRFLGDYHRENLLSTDIREHLWCRSLLSNTLALAIVTAHIIQWWPTEYHKHVQNSQGFISLTQTSKRECWSPWWLELITVKGQKRSEYEKQEQDEVETCNVLVQWGKCHDQASLTCHISNSDELSGKCTRAAKCQAKKITELDQWSPR